MQFGLCRVADYTVRCLCSSVSPSLLFFFFNDTATPEFSSLPLHDALPILRGPVLLAKGSHQVARIFLALDLFRFGDHPPCPRPALLGAISELAEHPRRFSRAPVFLLDRKSTRLNSSHDQISYAVFCLKKKT